MRLTRTNDSIHWLACLLAASACCMASSRIAIAVAVASLVLVVLGTSIRHVFPSGAGPSLRHFVAPALAVAFASAAVLRAVA